MPGPPWQPGAPNMVPMCRGVNVVCLTMRSSKLGASLVIPKGQFFCYIREVAADWDGSEPIRARG